MMGMPRKLLWWVLFSITKTNVKLVWYEFAELYHKYKAANTTNYVESLNSVRRKYTDKRLNFSATYKCRSNISILSTFLENWVELLMEKLDVPLDNQMLQFLKVLFLFKYIILLTFK